MATTGEEATGGLQIHPMDQFVVKPLFGGDTIQWYTPTNVTLWMAIAVLALIEIISYFVRPLSHSIRLGGNLMAGHAVIKVFAGFAGALGVASVVPIAAITAMFGLELLVAAVQAYVFTILTCVYLRDAVGEAHH